MVAGQGNNYGFDAACKEYGDLVEAATSIPVKALRI
jgi:hypothetical protein